MTKVAETLREVYSPIIDEDTLETLRRASCGEVEAFCIYTESGALLDIRGLEAQDGDVVARITAAKECVEEAIGSKVAYLRIDSQEARDLFIALSDGEAQ